MLNIIRDIDHSILFFVYHNLKNPIFDVIMPFVTREQTWIIPAIATALGFLIFGNKRVKIVIILGLITVAIVDPLCHRIIKPLVGRIRPFYVLADIKNLVNAGLYSFPSNHAANLAGIAVIISAFYRRVGYYFIGLAFLEGFSRVYCGVHYPLDVLGGYIIGTPIAFLVLFYYKKVENKYHFGETY